MQTVKKMPRDLQIGDIIVDVDPETGKPKVIHGKVMKTKVTRVEHYACSKRDTHINSSDCYPWSVPVEVLV